MVGLLYPAMGILASLPSPAPYLVAIALGFIVGAAGHVIRSNLLILTGIGMIAAATILFQQQISHT